MPRKNLRFRIDDTGCLEVVDPDFDCLDLLQSIDPTFKIRQAKLPGVNRPRFLQTRQTGCGIIPADLVKMDEKFLWDIDDKCTSGKTVPAIGQANLLDVKIELARREMQECGLCNRNCGVDRTKGVRGRCGLDASAVVAEHFVHITEEPEINPSFVLNLAGCGLTCCFCQQSELLSPKSVGGEPLTSELWKTIFNNGGRSLSFAGGNPDESLYGILQFLKSAPKNLPLPIVWNSNGYGSLKALKLLDGIVDVYLPDYKFENPACAQKLAKAPDYPAAVKESVKAMIDQDAQVIVRILVLPGHFECCHEPALDYLKQFPAEKLWVSVRGQYCPDWKVNSSDGALSRRPTSEEIDDVTEYAWSVGLALID